MDFKAAREAKGLTLEQVSKLAGYAIPTVNALELEGRGSDRLRNRLMEIYNLKRNAPAEITLREDEAPYNSETDLWRRRAKAAERELASLRQGLRNLLESSSTDTESQAGEMGHEKRSEAVLSRAREMVHKKLPHT